MILLDMEIPKSCFDCRFRTDTGRCELTGFYTSYQPLTMPLSELCPIKAEIPKNATNGDVIQSVFPSIKFGTLAQDDVIVNKDYSNNDEPQVFIPKRVWNAPYRRAE